MTKQPEYNSLTDWYLHRQENEATYKQMNSETDVSGYSNYDEFVNAISFVGNILQPFQFEPLFTADEIQASGTRA